MTKRNLLKLKLTESALTQEVILQQQTNDLQKIENELNISL